MVAAPREGAAGLGSGPAPGLVPTLPAVAALRRQRGFTLIELMLVVAIIAIATGVASLALRDPTAAKLEQEAVRLAALLESARAQSRASGIVVRWRPVEGSFVFDGLPPGALPSGWAAEGITAQAALSNGTPVPALQLGPDPIIAAQQVMLHSAGPPARALRIATDGVRPFTVSAVQ